MRLVSENSGGQQRLFAVRGAVQAEANEADAIVAATTELMRELLDRNELAAEAIVSCIFTTTDDLDAEFPAVAARELGLEAVPLLCCREIPVPDSMPRVIRPPTAPPTPIWGRHRTCAPTCTPPSSRHRPSPQRVETCGMGLDVEGQDLGMA
jgi:chorismate mutase